MPEVARFLRTVFGLGESHRMFQPDVLRWKCCAPHPFWEGSRGYAFRYKGEIAAFGCLVPRHFLSGSATVTSCCVIDWAAAKSVPGAGVMLYREIQRLTGTMINIGGTEDARSVLPRMGFQTHQQVNIYTRVLRPLRHFRQTKAKDWKSPLRLARDYRELARPAQSVPPDLNVRRVDRLDSSLVDVMPDPSVTRTVVCARTPELLNYCLDCPAAKMEAYLFEREKPVGYCLLSRVGRQCRIADLWIRSAEQQSWAEAYAAAASAARLDPHTSEVTAAASLPLQNAGIRQAGYRLTNAEPLFVLDPGAALGGRNDISIHLLENDAWYWSETGA